MFSILKIETKETGYVSYHIFQAEFGGFARGDSWRLSTGIKEIKHILKDEYQVITESGSVKHVSTSSEIYDDLSFYSMYHQTVLNGFLKDERMLVSLVSFDEVKNIFMK